MTLFALPSCALQTSSPTEGISQVALPEHGLPVQAPGSAQRHCQDLLNVKSRALWCHPATIWGA